MTANRRRLFQVDQTAELILDVIKHYHNERRFALHAFVIMPDHLHLLMTPAPDVSLEKAVQFIKGGFSFRLKSRRHVWERGFNEVQIRTAEKFDACKRYIEGNPVRAKLAACAGQYSFSSASCDFEFDVIPQHFLGTEIRG